MPRAVGSTQQLSPGLSETAAGTNGHNKCQLERPAVCTRPQLPAPAPAPKKLEDKWPESMISHECWS